MLGKRYRKTAITQIIIQPRWLRFVNRYRASSARNLISSLFFFYFE